jgi:hypothetical protein
MSEEGSEPDIEPRRYNVAEVPLTDVYTSPARSSRRCTKPLARVGARARGKLGGPREAYSRSGLRWRSGALDRRSLKKA